MTGPFVAYVTLNTDEPLDPDAFPGNLDFTRDPRDNASTTCLMIYLLVQHFFTLYYPSI